jgi:hypothetical protein
MVKINNPNPVFVQSNMEKVAKRWDRLIKAFKPTLLQNMRKVTYMLKTSVVSNKLYGQVLNRRTGNLIRSMLPNDENQAGHIESNGDIVGIVGAQGAIAPYARIHEYGGNVTYRVGAGARGGFGARGASQLSGKSGNYSKRKLKIVGQKADQYLAWAQKHPPGKSTRHIVGRFYIGSTIQTHRPFIKAMLTNGVLKDGDK